jgi:hypothetical protein
MSVTLILMHSVNGIRNLGYSWRYVVGPPLAFFCTVSIPTLVPIHCLTKELVTAGCLKFISCQFQLSFCSFYHRRNGATPSGRWFFVTRFVTVSLYVTPCNLTHECEYFWRSLPLVCQGALKTGVIPSLHHIWPLATELRHNSNGSNEFRRHILSVQHLECYSVSW